MKTLQAALHSLFSEQSSSAHQRRHSRQQMRQQARQLGAELGVCFEALPGGGMNVWPPSDCQDDPFEADHYAHDWADAWERVQAYATARDRELPACLQALSPRARALLNDSMCKDDASTDEEMLAHWRAELGLSDEQAKAAIAYRPRCRVDALYRPFRETLDAV